MGASDRAADLPTDDGPSKKSFLSLLSLPLRTRTRNRNLAEFYVRVDDPHRQYSAGDHVTGSVIVSSIKPIRVTHLTASLHGYVRVFKNAAQVNATPTIVPSGGNNNFRYFGNGHAQLFQDEQVLCGEGRLDARCWEFKFDLLFPTEGLHSSIDFERGTIAYMVTATLTRPTTMAPTTSVETKIALVEKVDVGLVPLPRERKVTMHAMHKRQRRKKVAPSNTTPTRSTADLHDPASDLDSTRAAENSVEGSVVLDESNRPRPDDQDLPRSPIQSDIQSEVSAGSVVSHNSNSARGADGSGGSSGSKVSAGADGDREIAATVELLRGGCMPGDLLPVRITVDHNRRMKSMHGIIVTFYRQGRVDYAPPTSLFTNLSKEDARKLEREEFYPKSRTGLGGLSLSSAGSCSVFRKDLSQAVAPLIIDPTTLSANITTSVRVPEDVFPSIEGVPGGLITFKYHVEVVVDLGGRLAGQSQGTSQQPTRMGSMSTVSGSIPAAGAAAYDRQLSRLANWNGSIVDTDHLRREKGVISVAFDVVVGNVDTNRSKSKAVARPTLTLQPPSVQGHSTEPNETNNNWKENYSHNDDYEASETQYTPHAQPHNYFSSDASPQAPHYEHHDNHGSRAPSYVPPPQIPDQSRLTEKDRVRQAEQRLLPSEPPMQSGESIAGPSQPLAPPEVGSQPSAPTITSGLTDGGPSAPQVTDLSSMAANSSPSDDKQELERRRLLTEASMPPDMPEDYEAAGPSAPTIVATGASIGHEPSAPMLQEHDAYGSHYPLDDIAGPSTTVNHHGREIEHLPKYER